MHLCAQYVHRSDLHVLQIHANYTCIDSCPFFLYCFILNKYSQVIYFSNTCYYSVVGADNLICILRGYYIFCWKMAIICSKNKQFFLSVCQ